MQRPHINVKYFLLFSALFLRQGLFSEPKIHQLVRFTS